MLNQIWHGFLVPHQNAPEERAGVYMLRHLLTGRAYIGISYNISKRIRQHAGKSGKCSKIGKAIATFGRASFEAVPLYYALNGAIGLAAAERELIQEFKTADGGYNTNVAGRGAGPYGKRFCEIAKAIQWTPALIEKRKRTLADRALVRRRGRAISIAQSRPEVKAKMRARKRAVITEEMRRAISDRMKASQNTEKAKRRVSRQTKSRSKDPAFRRTWLPKLRAAAQDPERRKKISSFRAGGMWINNGTRAAYLPANEQIPEGWKRGKKPVK